MEEVKVDNLLKPFASFINFIGSIISFIYLIISFISYISPQSIITIIIIVASISFFILLLLFIKDFSKISRIITFTSYLSNFSKDVKRKFSDYQTNLVFILRVVFIPFFLSLILYVIIIKLFRDSSTNFIIEIFYPSLKTLELPEKEKIVLVWWILFLVLLLFIWLMYFALNLKVRESMHNKLPKNTGKKNKLKVKELIHIIFVFTFVFLISISFFMAAEYSRVINELYYYIFIVFSLIVPLVLFLYKFYSLVEKFLDNLNRGLSKQKIKLPKTLIIAKNLRVVGEIVNLNLDRIEIIEKHSKKCKRYSIPWSKISDIFCVEVKKFR
jgi:hypothetical protein